MAWSKYKEIRYALGGIPSANLTDFPKLIGITADADIASELSGGGGVKFTSADGSSDLAFGLYPSSNLAAGTILARVKIGSLLTAASVGDVIARLYYSASESTTQNRAGVVSSSYLMFAPLEEDPSGSAPQMRDWVTDTLLGTSSGSMTSGDSVTGQVGKGLDFDGADDMIALGDPASVDGLSALTLEATIFARTIGQNSFGRILNKGDGNPFGLLINSSTQLGFQINSTAGNFNGFSLNTWQGIAGVFASGSKKDVWFNGSKVTGTPQTATLTANTELVRIGNRGSGLRTFDGIIDELRISSVARADDWLAYAYADDFTNSGTFTLSAEQGGSPAIYRRSPFVSPIFNSPVIRGVA